MKKHLNYFSGSEQGFIKSFEAWRTKLLRPISRLLITLHITPNMISYFGLLLLAGFIYYLPANPIVALYFLVAHVFIDAFDGSLARELKQDSDAGALTDIVCDHTGMVIVIATLLFYQIIGGWVAVIYVYLYTVMIIFIVLLNRLKISLPLIIRSKYYIYILFAIWAIWKVNYLTEGLIIFSLLMIPSVLQGYARLHRWLR